MKICHKSVSLFKNHTFVLFRSKYNLNVHVEEQEIQDKYCLILLMYQLLEAAYFSLWWFPFAKRQSPYLKSPLHLLILFWIVVTVPQASEICLTPTATFVLYISLIYHSGIVTYQSWMWPWCDFLLLLPIYLPSLFLYFPPCLQVL